MPEIGDTQAIVRYSYVASSKCSKIEKVLTMCNGQYGSILELPADCLLNEAIRLEIDRCRGYVAKNK